ncbi:unnamed protein product [Cunninghamella blakesleeana]
MNHSKESLILLIEQYKVKISDKEEENRQLRARAYEWKKKALENESLNHTLIHQYEEREKQLLIDHENQMNALTSAHVEKMNDMSNLILKLQEQLDQSSEQQQQQQQQDHYLYHHQQLSSAASSLSSSYTDSSNNISKHIMEDIHIPSTNPKVIHHQHKATDLILNMNDLMVDIETRINDYIAINRINHVEDDDENNNISDYFETSTSSEESEDEENDHHHYTYDQDENRNLPSIKLKNTTLSSATSFISPSSTLSLSQQQHQNNYPINNQSNQQYQHSDYNNNPNNDIYHHFNDGNDDDDDLDSHSSSSIHRYPTTNPTATAITTSNHLYKKKNRSSFSFFSNSSSLQQQQQQKQPTPTLHSKPTMEHLSKVIPNFLKKPIKSEQWKISHRHSFIDKRV